MGFLTALVPLPYRLIALALLVAGAGSFGWVKGAAHVEKSFDIYRSQQEATTARAAAKAAQLTTDLKARAAELEKIKNDEIKAIDLRLSTALASLRSRPARRVETPATAAACTGATGADLSRPDAEFLVGEAARADHQRQRLDLCVRQYNQVIDAVDRLSSETNDVTN